MQLLPPSQPTYTLAVTLNPEYEELDAVVAVEPAVIFAVCCC